MAVLTPPQAGKAIVCECTTCRGTGKLGATRECFDCHGTTWMVWRACPSCGDIGWRFVNGYSEHAGMVCALSCGYRWAADHPDWVIQHVPAA